MDVRGNATRTAAHSSRRAERLLHQLLFPSLGRHQSLKVRLCLQESTQNCVATEAEKVLLYGQLPPIVKMDNTLGTLKAAKHLALSSNCIEKITGLKGLDVLEVLSLGRNCIKKLEGLDDVANTLTQLWVSYNLIDKLNGLEKLTNLTVLYMRYAAIVNFFAWLVPPPKRELHPDSKKHQSYSLKRQTYL